MHATAVGCCWTGGRTVNSADTDRRFDVQTDVIPTCTNVRPLGQANETRAGGVVWRLACVTCGHNCL